MFTEVIEDKTSPGRCHHVVADLMRITLRTYFQTDVRIPKAGLHAAQHHRRMDGGDDDETCWATNPSHFTKQTFQLSDVIENQRTQDEVERCGREWQGLRKIANMKSNIRIGAFLFGALQHPIGKIDGSDPRSAARHRDCMPSGSAP